MQVHFTSARGGECHFLDVPLRIYGWYSIGFSLLRTSHGVHALHASLVGAFDDVICYMVSAFTCAPGEFPKVSLYL